MPRDNRRSQISLPIAELMIVIALITVPVALVYVVPYVRAIFVVWQENLDAENQARDSWYSEDDYNADVQFKRQQAAHAAR